MIRSRGAGRPRIRLRQIALFVLSMIVPSVVLVVMGVRMIVQQEELADKHLADQRRLRANEFERTLGVRLDYLREHPADPTVALVATLADGRLVLPWDRNIAADADVRFSNAVAAAEREEFGPGRLTVAESLLRQAASLARRPRDNAFARLVRARVLVKASRLAEASAEYRLLLSVPPDAVDDNGIPIALYAAERLLDASHPADSDRRAIAAAVDVAVRRDPLVPPAAWYLLRTIADKVAVTSGEAAARRRRETIGQAIADVEHALALQHDIQTLQAQWTAHDAVWLAHGAPLWLVGAGPARSGGDRVVVAVRGEPLAASLSPAAGGERFAMVSGGAAGEWLGERFPGLKVTVPPTHGDAEPRAPQRRFYAAALAIVLSVTLFGGYLLLRDVRREMRLAELRSQFVSSVSHELKTPLTAIRMFAETLQLGRVDAVTRDEYLETIVNESERLTRLLNNVLDFSKIEDGRKGYQPQPTSLADVVRVAARAMAYPLEQQGFVLRVEADDTLPPAVVDADALEQAILNLLTNAMKYSGSGRAIDLRLARDGRDAVISVTDEGIGIPLADQTRIFEKFYRVATPENERIPGTGLGLTLVDHIVKAHDGSIRVDSAPGRGSTFVVRLPLHLDEARLHAAEAAS